MEEENTVELEEENAVVRLPVNTVRIDMKASVFDGERIVEAHRIMDISEIRRAFMLAEEYYDDPDALYAITDKGREYLEYLRGQQ